MLEIINELIAKASSECNMTLNNEEEKDIRDEIGKLLSRVIANKMGFGSDDIEMIRAAELPDIPNFFSDQCNTSFFAKKTFDGDFSDYVWDDICLFHCNFTYGSKLPKQRNLFMKNSFHNVQLPWLDMNDYDWNQVDLQDENNVIFTKDSIMVNNAEFFQDICDRNIYGTTFPAFDMNKFDFRMVSLNKVTFTADTVFSRDKGFFRKLYNSSLQNVVLPVNNYSRYDFKGVQLEGVVFPLESILPRRKDFFQCLAWKTIESCSLPLLNLNDYDLSNVCVAGVKFAEGTYQPNNKNWMQAVRKKNFRNCILPSGDYREVDSSGADLRGVVFPRDAIISTEFLNNSETPIESLVDDDIIGYPEHYIIENFLYNEPSRETNLTKSNISQDILKILYAKYKNSETVILPTL